MQCAIDDMPSLTIDPTKLKELHDMFDDVVKADGKFSNAFAATELAVWDTDDNREWYGNQVYNYLKKCISEKLKTVSIRNLRSDDMPLLRYFNWLTKIAITDGGCKNINSLPIATDKLTTLILSNNLICDIDYKNIPKSLTYLDISDNNINELNLQDIPENLQTLIVNNNVIKIIHGHKEVNKLNLKVLSLRNNTFGELPPLPESLEKLDISDNNFDSRKMTSYIFPQRLENLNISRIGIRSINLLPNTIKFLNVSKNRLGVVTKMPKNIVEANFENCNIELFDTKQIFKEFSAGDCKLEKLNLRNNELKHLKFEGDIFPPALSEINISENHIQLSAIEEIIKKLNKDINIITDKKRLQMETKESHIRNQRDMEARSMLSDDFSGFGFSGDGGEDGYSQRLRYRHMHGGIHGPMSSSSDDYMHDASGSRHVGGHVREIIQKYSKNDPFTVSHITRINA